jgi:hypothetical protein
MVNNYDQYPYFQCNYNAYPNRDQQLHFIRSYVRECLDYNVNVNKKLFDEEKILIEANYFALASHFFWSVWAICQAAATKIQFSYLVSINKQKTCEGDPYFILFFPYF